MTTPTLLAKLSRTALILCAAMAWPLAHAADRVYFEAPADNATVTSPFKVKFGLEGMKIGPLGDMTDKTGHHHLIINSEATKAGDPVPVDEKHLHFGKGQTETEVSLPPGKHTLTLQFGNGAHVSYGAGMSKTITVTVVPSK
ncbi:MAG: rod shape-determining protein RodA [Burkholderiales bacterium PBB4]|nr:MAG: rod shape-determining protein RodA [Burkholderiales bacterium PBB4]